MGPAASLLVATRIAAFPFGPPINVSQSAGNSFAPTIAVQRGGTAPEPVHVFWHDFTSAPVGLDWATGDGSAFGLPSACPVNVDASRSPRAVHGLFGTHLVWRNTDGAGQEEIDHAFFDGAGWSAPVNVSRTTGSSRNPVIAVDSFNRPHVVWMDNLSGSIRFYEAHFDGVTWSVAADTGLPFQGGTFVDTLRLACDSTGTLHAVWDDGVTSLTEVHYAARPPGGPWGAVENLSLSQLEASVEADVAIGPGDVPHVVWSEQDVTVSTVFNVVHTKKTPAVGWRVPIDVSRQGGNCIRPVVAVGADGEARIAWTQPLNREIYYVPSPGAPPVVVSDTPGDISEAVAMDLDSAGNAHVAWVELVGSNREIFSASTRSDPVVLKMVADRVSGDVLLTWTGGSPNFRVERSSDTPLTPPVELTPPGGIPTPAWTDAGVLRDGVDDYYNVP